VPAARANWRSVIPVWVRQERIRAAYSARPARAMSSRAWRITLPSTRRRRSARPSPATVSAVRAGGPPGVLPDRLCERTPVRQRAAVHNCLDRLGRHWSSGWVVSKSRLRKLHCHLTIRSARSASTVLTVDQSCQRGSSAL